MSLTADQLKALVTAAAQSLIDHAEELTGLDQAIGDGDHGINMKRGSEAVLADLETIVAKPLPDALKAIGTQLVMKVGGAAGPLYGTLFMALGKALPADGVVDRDTVAGAFAQAIDGVKARGKSVRGQKTMLDVLIPVQEAFAAGNTGLDGVAADAAEATIPMLATRGRASFLGERSVGHMDPGARSSQLLIEAIVKAWETRP